MTALAERDVLLAAAALASRQQSASAAIRVALMFADRYPSAIRVLEQAEHRDQRVSLAAVLASHCGQQADVAQSFRHAAESSGAAA
jgi:hypothetical protein